MSGKAQSTISERYNKTHRKSDVKTAEIDTTTGIKTHRLISAETVFEWTMKDKPELALAMGKAGATVYLHKLAGFEKEPQPKTELPPSDIRVNNLKESIQFFGFDIDNPRFKQSFQDLAGDILGISSKPALPEVSEQWCGVAERVEELGYAASLVVKTRSQLGKYVKSFGLESKQEKRLCNGTMRPINIYKVCEKLDSSIKEFMDAKVLAS